MYTNNVHHLNACIQNMYKLSFWGYKLLHVFLRYWSSVECVRCKFRHQKFNQARCDGCLELQKVDFIINFQGEIGEWNSPDL
jgi:hypothetical protein